jgi:chemotaxis protein MotB
MADIDLIVVKKVKKGHGGHHGGAWKVAYADFVTAMMALFMVLWLVGQSKQTKEAIGQYFRDPGAFTTTAGSILSEDAAATPGPAVETPRAEVVTIEGLRGQQRQAQELLLTTLEKKLHTLFATSPEFARLKDQVAIDITEEGMRIDLLEKDGSSFFDVGSTQLQPSAVAILRAVAAELRALSNLVIIEGHTDSRPYGSSSGYSNWELSTDRANSARRMIEKFGVQTERIVQVRGHADKQLRYPDQPYDIRNRRVSVVVLYDT